MNNMNRLYNCDNPNQGRFKRVLCVCSAGLLRSPTAAFALSQEPFNYNTRSAGCFDYALIPVDEVLIKWADEIVCMSPEHVDYLNHKFKLDKLQKTVICLDIPDMYRYREAELVDLIVKNYSAKKVN